MNKDQRKALLLAILTVSYNLLEGVVALTAAFLSGSTALLGFGLDSFIESLSGTVMIWRFGRHGIDSEDDIVQQVERRAARLVAWTFFLLGTYVLIDAGLALWHQSRPDESLLGLGLAIASLVIMPLLYTAKMKLGRKINSPSLIADAKETLACLLLTIALLIGLAANALFQAWWLDPVAAIVIAFLVIREGMEIMEEEHESS